MNKKEASEKLETAKKATAEAYKVADKDHVIWLDACGVFYAAQNERKRTLDISTRSQRAYETADSHEKQCEVEVKSYDQK